jgi:hypothetical protein
MDTAILQGNGRSFHCNKSQIADPFVVLSRIIVDKTKCVKDPFSAPACAEASHDALLEPYYGFWEKWGNARAYRIEPKKGREQRRKGCATLILERPPSNLVSLHVERCSYSMLGVNYPDS